jgi:uncharacterized membrane protein YphA (DoxX/SURF4 family)
LRNAEFPGFSRRGDNVAWGWEFPIPRILANAYPTGRQGAALLVLRAALGIGLVVHGSFCLSDPGVAPAMWWGLISVAAGALLTIGLLTPLVALVALGTLVPIGSTGTPFDAKSAAILVGILFMGPGALSVDARLFGRREILIPTRTKLN